MSSSQTMGRGDLREEHQGSSYHAASTNPAALFAMGVKADIVRDIQAGCADGAA
jgi:hypothetical protein